MSGVSGWPKRYLGKWSKDCKLTKRSKHKCSTCRNGSCSLIDEGAAGSLATESLHTTQ